MREIQYIPLSAAVADVYRFIDEDAVDTSNIDEWSAYAMSKMQVNANYEQAVDFIREQALAGISSNVIENKITSNGEVFTA